jgi:hypothetical protein
MFVWDLDETLIIFQTLSNGRYAELFSGFKDPWEGSVLGRRWEQLILEVCDDYFFYKQVKTFIQPSVVVVQNFLLPQHLEALKHMWVQELIGREPYNCNINSSEW